MLFHLRLLQLNVLVSNVKKLVIFSLVFRTADYQRNLDKYVPPTWTRLYSYWKARGFGLQKEHYLLVTDDHTLVRDIVIYSFKFNLKGWSYWRLTRSLIQSDLSSLLPTIYPGQDTAASQPDPRLIASLLGDG